MRLLVMGDTHIPGRAKEIPPAFFDFVKEFCPQAILFTGDATEYATLFLLEKLAPVYAVKGNMDSVDTPQQQSLKFEGKKILLIHGDQFGRGNYDAMVKYAHGHGILVCGHTHRQELFSRAGITVVNPGSVTGAWGAVATGEKTFTTIIIKGQVEIEEYVVEEDGIQRKGSEGRD